MAAPLRHHSLAGPLPYAEHTFPRVRLVQFSSVHMEQEESGDKVELSGFISIHGALSALGFDGLQLGIAWDGAER